jgi:hypothetical protein
MQRIFRVRNSGSQVADQVAVNEFLGIQGKVISVTAARPFDENNEMGAWLVVADDGKEYKEVNKNPLD